MNKEKLKNKIEKTKEEIKSMEQTLHELQNELEKKEGRWKPNCEDEYYCVLSDGNVCPVMYRGLEVGIDRLSIGNYFKTKEEAEFMVENLKVIEELKEFAFEPNWENSNQKKWYLSYYHDSGKIGIYYAFGAERMNEIYFVTHGECKKAIETVGEDRIKKYLFRVIDKKEI